MKYYKNKGCQSDKAKPKKVPKPATLCWECDKLDCSWMRFLEPVAGWTATPDNVGFTNGKKWHSLPSYNVQACPGFVKAKKKKKFFE